MADGDIVERLRATGGKGQCGPLKAEAADEIARLRVHTRIRPDFHSSDLLERLTAQGSMSANEAVAEILRLRSELAEAREKALTELAAGFDMRGQIETAAFIRIQANKKPAASGEDSGPDFASSS